MHSTDCRTPTNMFFVDWTIGDFHLWCVCRSLAPPWLFSSHVNKTEKWKNTSIHTQQHLLAVIVIPTEWVGSGVWNVWHPKPLYQTVKAFQFIKAFLFDILNQHAFNYWETSECCTSDRTLIFLREFFFFSFSWHRIWGWTSH